jgi:hypothetical protein
MSDNPAQRVRDYLRSVYSKIDTEQQYYRGQAQKERTAFLSKLGWVRGLLYTGAVIEVIAASRIDRLIIATLFSEQAQTGRIADLVGVGVGLLGAVLLLLGGLLWRDLRSRGHLNGWVRYAATAETLRQLSSSLELASQRLLVDQTAEQAIRTMALAEATYERARQVVESETELWTKDVARDFQALLSVVGEATHVGAQTLQPSHESIVGDATQAGAQDHQPRNEHAARSER